MFVHDTRAYCQHNVSLVIYKTEDVNSIMKGKRIILLNHSIIIGLTKSSFMPDKLSAEHCT